MVQNAERTRWVNNTAAVPTAPAAWRHSLQCDRLSNRNTSDCGLALGAKLKQRLRTKSARPHSAENNRAFINGPFESLLNRLGCCSTNCEIARPIFRCLFFAMMYPNAPITEAVIDIRVVPDQPPVTTKVGIQFVGHTKLFQAQVDGWTFNKLAPKI